MSLLRFAVNGLNVTVVQVFHFARFIDGILDGIRWTFSRPYNLDTFSNNNGRIHIRQFILRDFDTFCRFALLNKE